MTTPADEAPVVEIGLGGSLRIGTARVAVADTFALLRAIARTRSVQGAATEIGLSYRAAWERVRALEADIGHQLVRTTRGHGTTLTETGAEERGRGLGIGLGCGHGGCSCGGRPLFTLPAGSINACWNRFLRQDVRVANP